LPGLYEHVAGPEGQPLKVEPYEMAPGVGAFRKRLDRMYDIDRRGLMASLGQGPPLTPEERSEQEQNSMMLALSFAPATVIPGVGRAAPKVGINLMKGAKKGIPKSMEKSLVVAAEEHAAEHGKVIFKGLRKGDFRYDGVWDYGEGIGKRAVFTVVKKGHPSHGMTINGPRIQKALQIKVGNKKQLFVAREGQRHHFDIYEALPADLQEMRVEAGYLVGKRFIPKAKLEKPVGRFAKELLKSEKGAITVGGKTEAQIDKEILKATPKEVKEKVRKMLDSWKKDDFKSMAEAAQELTDMGYDDTSVATIARVLRTTKK
jgi:hypothetical protein